MKFFSSVALLSAFAAVVAAVPTVETRDDLKFPEVTPGFGLPSLKELGVTSEHLYTMKQQAPMKAAASTSDAQPTCDSSVEVQQADAVACANYLATLADHTCEIPTFSLFCMSANTAIYATSLNKAGYQTTSCKDIADAVYQLANSCNNNGQIGGSQSPKGKENIAVWVMSSSKAPKIY